MGLGIKTAIRRRLDGPFVNSDYHEQAELAGLLAVPTGAVSAPPVDGAPLRLAFVVPSFTAGSGGHTTIANLVRALEARGHACSIWIDDPGRRLGPSAVSDFIAWFGPFAGPVSDGTEALQTGAQQADVVIATGWQTAARVRTLPAAGRAYLVQDHEPEFFGTSTQRSAAEHSYSLGLYPVTAGEWLASVMADRYGLPATSFDLGINGERYRPLPGTARRGDVVLAYARWSTPRRAVPIVLAAFAELHRRRPDVELWTFGQGGDLGVDFPHRNLGVLADAELPALYAQATAGVVLSMTNYSLVAQEMLACGLPCVELDSPSVVAAFGSGGAALLAPLDPGGVADALERLLSDPALRAGHAAAGARLREERTWAHAAEQVEAGLRAAIAHTQSA
ncbi:MAG: glycosyltransferase family 4 protein [Baekduia sp.]